MSQLTRALRKLDGFRQPPTVQTTRQIEGNVVALVFAEVPSRQALGSWRGVTMQLASDIAREELCKVLVVDAMEGARDPLRPRTASCEDHVVALRGRVPLGRSTASLAEQLEFLAACRENFAWTLITAGVWCEKQLGEFAQRSDAVHVVMEVGCTRRRSLRRIRRRLCRVGATVAGGVLLSAARPQRRRAA